MKSSEIRILVVDDDPDILNGTARLLENAGYAVGRAATGEETLQAVRDRRPDLLLLDRDLPGIDGLEVCRRIKQEPAQADIFVVMISASYTKSEEQAEGLEGGADDYIARPVTNRELLARVYSCVRILSLTRALRLQAEELKQGSKAADQAQLASLNLMEDAVAARERAEQASQTLKESEEKYRHLVENSHVIIYTLTADGVFTFVSPAWTVLLGHPPTQVVGQPFQQFVHPDDLAGCMVFLQRVIVTGQRQEGISYRVRHTDGSWRWHTSSAVPLRGEAGTVIGFEGIAQDITTRKQSEAALRESHELIVKLTAQVPGVVFQYQLHPDGHASIPFSSPGINVIYEVTPEEVREDATQAHRRHHPDDYDRIGAAIQESARTQQPFHCEFRVVLPRQGLRWRLCDSLPERMEDGSTLWHGIVSDITERKRAEEERARLAMAVEQAAETIVITDPNGTILYANPAFEETSGYTCAKALGQNPRILKSGKQDAEFYRQMWAILARGEVWTGRLINKKKDGTLYEEEVTISPVRDPAGKVVNYVAVKRDVTHEAQLEAQLRQVQKMEAVGQLAGGVAHDFNNLLAVIRGNAELLLMNEAQHPAATREGLKHVVEASERAANLTRQLLTFSRKQLIQSQPLMLNEVIANLTKMLNRVISENIDLQCQYAASLPYVQADTGMIEQVILNLVVNARDAMPQGGQLRVATEPLTLDAAQAQANPKAHAGQFVCLLVSDTGTGIAPEVLPRIFEPFFTTKEVGKGTGLGLATVYGIVNQHRGWIEVSSQVGEGSTFKVVLPAIPAPARLAAAAEAEVEVRGGKETILLVEDEHAVRLTTRKILESKGYTVREAASAREALEQCQAHAGEFALLLTDIIMPGEMSGLDLADRLWVQRPGLKVIFMSGYSADMLVKNDEFIRRTRSRFLQKPCSSRTFLETVRQCLDEKDSTAASADVGHPE